MPTTTPPRSLWRRGALLASALLIAGTALPVGTPAGPAPAGAATTALNLEGTINHTNSAIYKGAGPNEIFSSPAVADITGDNTPEIIIGNMDGTVEAFRATDRTKIWSRKVSNGAIQSSPAIGDVGGDGVNDVVVGTMDGRVVWLNGPTGHVSRTFLQGAPLHCYPGQDCRPDGFFATPALADINGDRIMDIIAPNYDHTVYAWTRTGGLLWRRFLEDTLWSSPVVADIDNNGSKEIILGGDIYANNPLRKPAGGLIWVLKSNGQNYGPYPKSIPGQTVWSSPAVADLNNDRNLDIIVGTGANWPEPAGRQVHVFTARTGNNHPGWPVNVDGRVVASPAIGDLDDDGILEISVASDGGWVYAYERNGTRMWRRCNAMTDSMCRTGYNTKAGTVIADVDSDGIQEVVSTLDKDVRVYDARNGNVEASYRMANPQTLAPGASPVVAEVNGVTKIIQSSMYRFGHTGLPRAGDITKVYVFNTGKGLCRSDWPQFRRDARRTGTYSGAHGQWTPFDCPADFVKQQYRDFLNREPDAGGVTSWTARLHNGMTGSTVIRSFLGSSEFAGAVAPVMRAYLATHGTYPPDAQTIRDAVSAFRQGETAAEIADLFAADPKVAALSDAQYVDLVYRSVYKRPPSASESTADVAKLEGGMTRGTLASGYAESQIGKERLGAEVNVAMVFLGMLGRAPDPSGWSYWVPKARATSTDALVKGFQTSSEYRRRVVG